MWWNKLSERCGSWLLNMRQRSGASILESRVWRIDVDVGVEGSRSEVGVCREVLLTLHLLRDPPPMGLGLWRVSWGQDLVSSQ